MSTEETYRWTVHDADTVYDGAPWLHVDMVEVSAPSGETIQHARVRIPDAAIALVVDEPRQRVLMLHRHRWVPDRVGFELLGGLIDDGETPAEAALREAIEESGHTPIGDPEHLITVDPMPGVVDSTTHIYLWRRGAEHTGEPSDPHETGIIGWIPLDRVAQLAEQRQLLGAGTVVALDHYLAHHAPATTTPAQPRPPRCSTWIEVPSPLREWLTALPDSSFDLTAQTGRVQCDLGQGHEHDEPVHHTMLQQHTTGGDEWWLRWTAHGTITGIVQLPPCPATTPTSAGLCLLYRDHPGTHH